MTEMIHSEDVDIELVDALPGWAREKGFWKRALEPLRSHPGTWARVRRKIELRDRRSVSYAINHGVWAGTPSQAILPSGIWRAAIRGGELYVCFCGERSE